MREICLPDFQIAPEYMRGMTMVSGVYWSVGNRTVNEDTVALESVHTDRGKCTLIVVCDGIGSLSNGEIVSGYVTECLIRWFYTVGVRLYASPIKKIKRSLCKCIYDCHMELKETARRCGIEWGTTCTCICILGRRYVCMHLGDSAAYRLDGMHGRRARGRIRRITRAHVNAGGELVRCVGSRRYCEPEINGGILLRGSGLLAASDGFAACFSGQELMESLQMGDEITQERLERRLAAMGNEAAARGCTDNRSAVCVLL